MRPARFAAVNLISDPIHGYIELTKRLAPGDARAAGLARGGCRRGGHPRHGLAAAPAPDQPAPERPLGLPDGRAFALHPRPRRHARGAGCGAASSTLRWWRRWPPPSRGCGRRPRASSWRRCASAGLLHDVGHGPFAHFFDEHVLAAFPAPTDGRRTGAKALTHEDLSQLIIERELGPLIRRLRRAPGDGITARDAFADGESIDPAWVAYLVAKPRLDDPAMPRWVRWLQPLLSGVFTVDNLDYVRRDAYFTGVSAGPVDAERLRRYAFISERGLTLYEPGLAALEMFLTARLFMYQQVYFHRTVRGIDLDLAEVFAPSIRAIFGEGSPADDLRRYADLDEYALLHQAARWGRGEDVVLTPAPGDGRVAPHVAGIWRRILLRRPRWRAEAEVRAEFETGPPPTDAVATLGAAEPGRVIIDLAVVDARPSAADADALLAIAGRDGRPPRPLAEALGRLPAYALIGRRYVRVDGE